MLDVVVVGGGPVGLLLGCRLAQLGVRFVVLEQRKERAAHTRAIGIHPPALEHLRDLGLAGRFLRAGVKVRRGHAFAGGRALGTLDFARCPGPYGFVLTIPQDQTERLLERQLEAQAPGALIRATQVRAVRQTDDRALVRVRQPDGIERLAARFVVGADGKRSVVRAALGIEFAGGPYDDRFLMGDFEDETDLGGDAAVFLADEGLVESFPLPGGRRRWVIATDGPWPGATPVDLCRAVERRTGERVSAGSVTMLGAFGVERYLAGRFAVGRVALAGDAAHVVSPIGGQGMNLGWLDAWELCDALQAALTGACPAGAALDEYHRNRVRAARGAIRRAELNMAVARRRRHPALRNAGLRLLLRPPLAGVMARMVTMRGL